MVNVGAPPSRWRGISASLSSIPRTFQRIWATSRIGTVLMALITLLLAALPAAQAWTAKLIVDAVVQAIGAHLSDGAGLQATLPFLLLELGLLALMLILNESRTVVQYILTARLRHSIQTAIMRQALSLDLYYFEDAAFYDKLQNAREEAGFRALTMMDTSFHMVQSLITLIS